jgi:hypothetical protein
MNYHWANLKSDLYRRITGFNLFNSKELDVAMDSNEKRDESDKDVNDATKLGIMPAACAANANLASDTLFIGVHIIGYFALKNGI